MTATPVSNCVDVTATNMIVSAGIIAVYYMPGLLCRHAHTEIPEHIYFVQCPLSLVMPRW